jgi:hypothetical protein
MTVSAMIDTIAPERTRATLEACVLRDELFVVDKPRAPCGKRGPSDRCRSSTLGKKSQGWWLHKTVLTTKF